MVTRVFLVDDEALVRGGFRMLIEAEDDLEVVGEASDGLEALTRLRTTAADVVLMDVRMPVMDGVGEGQTTAGATGSVAAAHSCAAGRAARRPSTQTTPPAHAPTTAATFQLIAAA